MAEPSSLRPNELAPVVGQWYLHRDKGEMFRVVAADSTAGWVETQDFDGDVEELDMDAWRSMQIELAEAPEDWTGPFDDIESDDLGYTETGMSTQDWREPLESLRAADEMLSLGEREEMPEERSEEADAKDEEQSPRAPR